MKRDRHPAKVILEIETFLVCKKKHPEQGAVEPGKMVVGRDGGDGSGTVAATDVKIIR